eukprot:1158048-Pelagomonas_calceolata.AAC.19
MMFYPIVVVMATLPPKENGIVFAFPSMKQATDEGGSSSSPACKLAWRMQSRALIKCTALADIHLAACLQPTFKIHS